MDSCQHSRLQRNVWRVWLAVGVCLLAGAALHLLARPLAVLSIPLLVALLLVYLLNPIVSALARIGVPRLVGALTALTVVFAALAGAAAAVLGPLTSQVSAAADIAPVIVDDLARQVDAWLASTGVDADLAGQVRIEAVTAHARQLLADADTRTLGLTLLAGLAGLATDAATFALALTVGVVAAVHALWDLPRMRRWALRAIPPQHRCEARAVARRLSRVVGGFIQGQLVVATFVGTATSIGLAVIDLPFWLVLGVIAAITNLIPFLGPVIAGALAIAVALVTDGPGLAALTLAVMIIVQQAESQIVSPLVVGRTVALHPLAVLLALLVAGTLHGILGLLVVVPATAAANVLLSHLWHTRIPWAGAGKPVDHRSEAIPLASAPSGGPSAGGPAR